MGQTSSKPVCSSVATEWIGVLVCLGLSGEGGVESGRGLCAALSFHSIPFLVCSWDFRLDVIHRLSGFRK